MRKFSIDFFMIVCYFLLVNNPQNFYSALIFLKEGLIVEFIKVSDNKKGFCTDGGSPFYPFGGNFIFDCELTDDPSGEDRQI